jgi:hypothetical protein
VHLLRGMRSGVIRTVGSTGGVYLPGTYRHGAGDGCTGRASKLVAATVAAAAPTASKARRTGTGAAAGHRVRRQLYSESETYRWSVRR